MITALATNVAYTYRQKLIKTTVSDNYCNTNFVNSTIHVPVCVV